jgi:serine/threonine protein kinase
MSPEQIREPKDAGAKSDVYSSGVVLYEMLTGVLPFNSRSLPKLIDAIYRGEKQAPSALRPEVNKELEAIVIKAMHPRQDQRFETAREFFEALEEYNARQPLRATAPLSMPLSSATPVASMAPVAPSPSPAPPQPHGDAARHWALVNVKPEANEKHAISGESVMVGRDRTCSIVLAHPAVSRRHARITLSGSMPLLEDLQSANGTYVNNTRVEKVALKPGDIVRFGADPACSYVLRDH